MMLANAVLIATEHQLRPWWHRATHHAKPCPFCKKRLERTP